jgi:DNA uptake protein ComE-like DNA-binding protein
MDRRVRNGAGIVWALLPFLTLGFATPVVFGYAAFRRRTAPYWITASLYLVSFGVEYVSVDAAEGTAGDAVFGAVFLLNWLVATAHAFIIRPRVFRPESRFQTAVDLAEYRRELRQQAREAMAADPAMAWELHIGRPDLPRKYDDGGLIDVNHVPPQVLASLPGMTPYLANRVAQVREQLGGFTSVEEMSVLAQLPPALAPQIGEYAVFLP